LATATPAKVKTHYIPTLDGWRAFSCLAVVIYHGSPRHANAIVSHGYLGVCFFFAISGFLITTRLLEEAAVSGGISWRRFYVRRVFRILPPAYLYIAVVVLLGLTRDAWDWAGCLLFFRNFVTDAHNGWYAAHYWSLAVEEQFYLFWPALLILLGFARARRAALAITLLVGVWRALNNRAHWSANQGLSNLSYDYIMWGCWWALALNTAEARARFRRVVSTPVWVGLAALLVLLLWLEPVGSTSLVAFVIPLLILGTVYNAGAAPGRFLELAPLRWVGRLSYSLYLWQQLFFVSLVGPPTSAVQRFPLNAVALLACAAASYYLVEKPMMRLGHRLAPAAVRPGRGA
jgi:peptidoglycan/LPS O-acetylase OafA/YrhL